MLSSLQSAFWWTVGCWSLLVAVVVVAVAAIPIGVVRRRRDLGFHGAMYQATRSVGGLDLDLNLSTTQHLLKKNGKVPLRSKPSGWTESCNPGMMTPLCIYQQAVASHGFKVVQGFVHPPHERKCFAVSLR